MPVGAIIGSTVLGVGGSIGAAAIGSSAQSKTTALQIKAAKDLQNQQIALQLPFLQRGYQATSALSQILGLPEDPTVGGGNFDAASGKSGPNFGAYVQGDPGLLAEYKRVSTGGFGPNLPDSFDYNGDGVVDIDEYGAFHWTKFGQKEGRTLPLYGEAVGPDGKPKKLSEVYNPESAFRNSLFFKAADSSFNNERAGLNANAAAGGSFFSGANALARETARERNFGSAFQNYSNALASLYGGGQVASGNAQNALAQQGAATQQALANRANAQSQFWGGVGNTLGGIGGIGVGWGLSKI